MKKKLMFGASVAITAIAAFAGICVPQNAGYNEIDGNDVYAGEFVNDTGVDYLGHDVQVAFLDAAGEVVEIQEVETCLSSFQAGATTFFSAEAEADEDDTASAIARVDEDSLEGGEVEEGDIELANVTAEREEDGEELRVTGTFTNDDNDELEDPSVCIVVYDNDGNVLVVSKDDGFDDLAEEESDSFSITIDVPDSTSLVDEVNVWIDGAEDGVPVAPIGWGDIDVETVDATSTPTPTETTTATATPTATPTP